MKMKDWPNCPTPDCENKICLWIGTGLCFQCSKAKYGVESVMMAYEATHDENGRLHPNVEGIE